MKKKTAQPRPKQRKTSESEKKKGLIAQKKTTGSSERAKSALDNRSHRTTQFRDTVAMQPGAVHYVVRFEGTDGTLDDDLRLIGLYCRDARRRHDSALRFIHTLRQTPAELLIIDNTSLRDVMGLDACCVCGKPWPDLRSRCRR